LGCASRGARTRRRYWTGPARPQDRLHAWPVIGQVHAVDGDVLTMAVVGLGEYAVEGVEVVPSETSGHPLAQVSSETLLGSWKRMGGNSGGIAA
jgi:hypothetical protein